MSPGPIEVQIKMIEGITAAALVAIDGAHQTIGLLVAIETATGDLPPGLAERSNPIMAPHMATFKLPITRRFPRTDTGKVKRREPADSYLQGPMEGTKT